MKASGTGCCGLLGLDKHSGYSNVRLVAATAFPVWVPGCKRSAQQRLQLHVCYVMWWQHTEAARAGMLWMLSLTACPLCTCLPAADGNGMRHLNCAYSGAGMKPLSNGHASDEVQCSAA